MRSMTLPGAGRVVMRRSAKDPASGLNAYIVKNSDGKPCNVSVALKRKDRYIGCVLKGHPNGIVDMEFLQTPPESLIFTLGTCDQDGVVFLWFLRLVKDKLGIDFELRVLRKYSFYSLRKNKTAYYNRIRLAGTPEEGTMVLVPNDGSDVRVISFSCEPLDDPGYPALAAPTSVPLIEAAAGHVGNTPTLAVLPPPTEHKSTELQMPTPQPVAQDQHTKSRSALGTDPADEEESGTGHSARAYAVGAAAAAGAAIGAAAIAASDSSEESEEEEVVEDEDVEEDVDVKDPLNSTFPLSRRVEETLVDDDIAEAAARGAGLTGSSLRTGGVPRDEVEVYEAEGEYEEDEYEEEEYEEEEYEEEGYQGEVVGQRRGVPATAARGT
eukprot:IDg8761t1